ncbi:MAG: translation initiation factor IF-2 [Stygiobacter sp. RIFOXYA12_FULL_38_9]|nr:MAG: translation initiation factor IF-2 [Stygiobacter sp. GWC2_38_9]OGU85432.1 MAG: translation initiation factor IF-2 [Stygiobacter sp. RIFOXYA12_FULL_38_9]OGV08189.1 MAG: translation initiation factor IF-2 [Stygiobacter sp. RIFOXYB2_FULL_37_11]OGV09853.1 MAG: translation initiation factor IF-2 [Stygiobacter sp. RIFOXYA2_FULL_38_8]OGV15705.1 MAG: translation initiation factor IF-2 [Stygiobacter sp. RIFOXYC2_FULL_38_25]OGV80819.1 MAG: translation initiation factor IF-2 [Stygiobacter sp. GWF
MSEPKAPKIRLYKLASEFNLSTESLMEFLQKKGFEVKNHMTLITDEMMNDIKMFFKKDIEKAEKHYKKIEEFQKKRGDHTEPEPKAEAKHEATPATEAHVVEEAPAVQEVVEAVATEEPVEGVVEEEVVESQEETEEVSEESGAEQEVITDDGPKIFKTETEKRLETQKKGLTIVGKIELNKRKPKLEERPKETSREAQPAKPSAPQQKAAPTTGAAPATESEADKKKKKVLKAKKKTGKPGEEGKEEPVPAKKKKKLKRFEVDKQEVEAAIRKTMLSMDDSALGDRALARKKKRKEKAEEQERILEEKILEQKTIKVTEFIAVNELANLMKVPVSDVISKCISLGLMVSINQRLDVETITLIADDFGFDIELQQEYQNEIDADVPDAEETLKFRPPVVTIMGHVDHGKTSLLDFIRRANVVAGEAGGITQHIGAYKVALDDGKEIAFLDTPGHEAFTAMRARGAKVTDIVVLIVAADDAVMPQTVEAINHAQAANVPIIVAINKVDKPNSNIERIKQQLAEKNILVEEWGGKYQCVEVSAKLGKNIDVLLEKIILEAELLDLKANPDRFARGTIIESQLDKGRGVTATVLVQKGTLKIGDPFIAGVTHGRVRAMFDERGKKVFVAGPSTPVLVLGFEAAPQAGDVFAIVESEREARETSIKRMQLKREQDHRQVHHITLDEIASQISQGGFKELPIIVKGDVDGSIEALSDSLMKLSNAEVSVNVIHKGVGAISEGDVLLATASKAIIIGFHVRPNVNARKLAEAEKVDIRLYNIIYDAIAEVKSALEGMLSPVVSEENVATIEVRDIFKVPKVGTIAGCYVTDGKVDRKHKLRLFRDGIAIYEGDFSSLKRFKDDVKEVERGFECGIGINNFNDIKVGDVIETYKLIETKKKLD